MGPRTADSPQGKTAVFPKAFPPVPVRFLLGADVQTTEECKFGSLGSSAPTLNSEADPMRSGCSGVCRALAHKNAMSETPD